MSSNPAQRTKLTPLLPALFLLFLLLTIIIILDQHTVEQMHALAFRPKGNLSTIKTPYPVLRTNTIDEQNISAQSIVVLDKNSGVTLFARNNTQIFPLASTTKIMAALVGLNYYNETDVITVKESVVEGTVVGFRKGEKVVFKDLLYAMLLPSGNDAAMAIADNYPGGRSAFVAEMNKQAKVWYLPTMHFVDPAGLEDEGDYATAQELARLAVIALSNKTFATIVATKQFVIKPSNTANTYSLTNLNKLLENNDIMGVKTGHTEKAGDVLVTSKKENGHTIITVIMKSQDRFGDTENLLAVLEGNIGYLMFRY